MSKVIHVDGHHSQQLEMKIAYRAQQLEGRYDGVSDKGCFFKFKDERNADEFRRVLRNEFNVMSREA